MDPLDLLSDLKGDDENTRVMAAVNLDEDYPDESETSISLDELLKNKEIQEEAKKAEEAEVEEEEEDTKEIPSKKNEEKKELELTKNNDIVEKDDSFFTNSTKFSQSDFDDFEDLKDDMKASKIIIRILIILLVLAFIAGLVILANNYLDLGLFK